MTKGKCKTMVEIRDIIHLLRNGHSNRCIHRETGIDRSIVKKIKELAIVNQWLNSTLPIPNDEEIAKVWNPKAKTQTSHPLDLYRNDLEQWRKEGHSAVVIYQLLKDKCSCDAQAIRRYLNKHFPKAVDPVMVRPTVPGQDIDIDFGYLGNFLNDEGILRKAWVFSFRLRHSRRAYRKVVLDQKISTFLMCHVYAFEWFSGVPKNVILDNTKSAIIQCTIDNDMVRRSYQELAEHYGFIITPCLPRTPEHKGGIEGDIKYVKKNFLPYFHARQKEKNIKVSSLRELIEALERWGREIADVHVVQGIGRSPLEIFKAEEEKALKTLPKTRWELTSWSQCTVRRDWRIMYDSAYYSVPFQFIDKTVQVCATTSLVRIFCEHKEIALHERAKEKWEYKRKTEHAPPLHEEVLQCTREGLLSMAEKAGLFIYQVAYIILSHPSVDKLRPVRHLLKLASKYSQERLEKACQRAIHYRTVSYISVKNILENNLDQQPLETRTTSKVEPLPLPYRFARNPADYKSTETFEEKLARLHPVSKHGNGMLGAFDGLLADQIMEEDRQARERSQS
jgi:transposase